MVAAILSSNLTKSYGERRGVFDLSLEVEPGEIFGFLGPNGSGKTTTIRLLLDLIRPQAGSAAVFGYNCRRQSQDVHRLTGYLPGEFALDPKLTGRQLLTYLANLRGGADWIHVGHICDALDLDLDRPFGQYSRGNKQKVGIAQAFMHRPRLLILDEPTGGLDPINQEAVLGLVREASSDGATIFFSSHILEEVERVCQRVAFIRDGRIVRLGPVRELLGAKGHTVEAECARPPDAAAFNAVPGVSGVVAEGNLIRFHVQGDMREAVALLASLETRWVISREPNLIEVFMGLYDEGQA